MPEPYLTTKEAAHMLKLSEGGFREMVRAGRGPSPMARRIGKGLRFPLSAIRAWMNTNETERRAA